MTKEEREKAIEKFQDLVYSKEKLRLIYQGDKVFLKRVEREIDIFNLAIEALSEESKIDKIKEEVEEKSKGNLSLYNKAINDVLKIIDKYREVEK